MKLVLLGSAFALVQCAPSAKQLKEAVEKDPSIVFVAIEKDPEKFIEVVNKAAQEAQKKQQEKMADDEKKQRETEYANPLKPEIDESRVIFGKKDAPVTIVEYSDFECPYCSRGYQVIKQVKAEYGDKVRVLFKHLPLDFHPMAEPAARYYEAIAMQDHGKAEKFHDKVFENQGELKSGKENFLKKAAKDVGANMATLEKDLKNEKVSARIQKDMEEAQSFGIRGTPGFIVNGISLRGALPFSEFKEVIDKHLKK
ncbi:MAG: thioredoxin domain-containing protein [Bdellovibrionaceae bacterium]|nr:thioredoxin domain-containing protein [Pseudobdellovibrionaceae bacterium]